MASSLGYVQYVASQLADAGVITYKKLFGEYGLWCGGKFFGTVEDNQFYVKMTNAGRLTQNRQLLMEGSRACIWWRIWMMRISLLSWSSKPVRNCLNPKRRRKRVKQRKYMAQITENDVQIHSKEGAGTV